MAFIGRILMALTLLTAAGEVHCEQASPNLDDWLRELPADPPLIRRVALIAPLSGAPRVIPAPPDLDVPSDMSLVAPRDLAFTISISDTHALSTRKQWLEFLFNSAKVDLIVEMAGRMGDSWTLTVPEAPSRKCDPSQRPKQRRLLTCLGYEGVVVGKKGTRYLAYAFRRDLEKGRQALLVKNSAQSMLLTGQLIVGDGLTIIRETKGSYVVLEALTHSSRPVNIGTKVVFEAETN